MEQIIFGKQSALVRVARPERFELPTPWFVAKYSIQMSYGRAEEKNYSKALGGNRSR